MNKTVPLLLLLAGGGLLGLAAAGVPQVISASDLPAEVAQQLLSAGGALLVAAGLAIFAYLGTSWYVAEATFEDGSRPLLVLLKIAACTPPCFCIGATRGARRLRQLERVGLWFLSSR